MGGPTTNGGSEMMKQYDIGGLTFQYVEGHQPEGAVEHAEPSPKPRPCAKRAKAPANKSREVSDK